MKKFVTRSLLVLLNIAIVAFFTSIPFWKVFNQYTKDEVNVFVWGAFLSPKTISSFEKEHNIKVNLHLCGSNEEMLAKVRRSKKGAYDVIFASDFAVNILKNENYLAPIDKSKLNFLDRISPFLLGHDFDPTNTFALPYTWEVYGIAQRSSSPPTTLEQIFEPTSAQDKVAMIPDHVEAFTVAAYYLFHKNSSLTPDQIEETKNLLRAQRNNVEAYVDSRARYLVATENCPTGFVKSSFLHEISEDSGITYTVPEEGTFTSIEHVVIPAGAKHRDAAHLFINHIYKKESYFETYELCAMFPACFDAIEGSIHDIPRTRQLIGKIVKKHNLVLYDYLTSPAQLRETWIEIKK